MKQRESPPKWIDLDQTHRPVYQNERGFSICEPCAQGYHEHHRQIVGWGDDPGFGEADCKNLIDGGQCCCFKQPTGTHYDDGIPEPRQKIKCGGCKELVKIAPVKHYRKPPIFCKECGLGWEINEGGGGWAPIEKIPWLTCSCPESAKKKIGPLIWCSNCKTHSRRGSIDV